MQRRRLLKSALLAAAKKVRNCVFRLGNAACYGFVVLTTQMQTCLRITNQSYTLSRNGFANNAATNMQREAGDLRWASNHAVECLPKLTIRENTAEKMQNVRLQVRSACVRQLLARDDSPDIAEEAR